MKTRKSVAKRIRITSTGKLMRRRMAQDHFRAGKAGRSIRRKRLSLKIKKADYRNITKHL
ncbi:MAG: 50S ribosomal protein L35 [Candidatus Colwellbacteria bacterium]|nr:50S ribosomal protein L35 [Candidatus Colwellbacteria bacterium]